MLGYPHSFMGALSDPPPPRHSKEADSAAWGGRSDSDPDPPPPRRSKVLRRSGPHLAQIWHQRPGNFFFWPTVGGKI